MNIHRFRDNENCMEFVFEVDDTGIGIPKDKQEIAYLGWKIKPPRILKILCSLLACLNICY